MTVGREAGPGRVEPDPVACATPECEGQATPPLRLCLDCIEASYPVEEPE